MRSDSKLLFDHDAFQPLKENDFLQSFLSLDLSTNPCQMSYQDTFYICIINYRIHEKSLFN